MSVRETRVSLFYRTVGRLKAVINIGLWYHVFMQIRDQHRVIYTPRPQSYAALMEMYESNYMRLRILCGDVRTLRDTVSSVIPKGAPIILTVLDRARHTTTIMLTYQFETGDKECRPDLRVRIYHDSRQAEVISRKCRLSGENIQAWEAKTDSALLCRWRLNRFLYKWLAYLHRQGHSFSQ